MTVRVQRSNAQRVMPPAARAHFPIGVIIARDIDRADATRLRAWPIVAGLAGGLVLGAVLHALRAQVDTAISIAQLIGSLWLNALRITLVPLIFSLVVTGVAAAAANRAGGQLGRRAGLLFVSLMLLSAFVGAILGSLLLDIGPDAAMAAGTAAPVEVPGASAWILGLVPPNIVSAAADGAIVPLVLFALIFNLAALIYPLAARSGLSFRAFSRAAAPAQAIAASTQSSLASLPVLVEAARRLDLPEPAAAVVLPLAVAVFRMAAPASIVIVTLALARMTGV